MEDKIIELAGITVIWLGKIFAFCATIAVTTWYIFRFLGKKWIENKFQKSLEDHKHKHDKEIQRLKCEIDSQLSRVTKIHEKEFEVLPQAWVKLDILLDSVRHFLLETNNILKFDKMSDSELEDFLSKSNLNDSAKQKMCNEDRENRKICYFFAKSKKASDTCLDFQDYITKNAIFLSSDIKDKFEEAEITIRGVLAIREATEWSKERQKGMIEACNIITKKIPQITKEIEQLVQKRLCLDEA